MKKYFFVFFLVVTFFSIELSAQKSITLNVKTEFKGILEGYDHLSKSLVYIDEKLLCETPEQLQSVIGNCKVTVQEGKHAVRIVNMAQYEGNWEEHSIDNDYSLDAFYEAEIDFTHDFTIKLLFDIEKEITIATTE